MDIQSNAKGFSEFFVFQNGTENETPKTKIPLRSTATSSRSRKKILQRQPLTFASIQAIEKMNALLDEIPPYFVLLLLSEPNKWMLLSRLITEYLVSKTRFYDVLFLLLRLHSPLSGPILFPLQNNTPALRLSLEFQRFKLDQFLPSLVFSSSQWQAFVSAQDSALETSCALDVFDFILSIDPFLFSSVSSLYLVVAHYIFICSHEAASNIHTHNNQSLAPSKSHETVPSSSSS